MPQARRLDGTGPTRRDFVRGASGVLLAAGAAAGGDEATPEPVRVAVIGTGARGCDLIRSLTTIPGADLVAVCDDYPPHLQEGARYAGPGARAFDDLRRLLDAAKPRAVVIAVPLPLHHRMAVAALEAGCDVFCEKTMCFRLDEAADLARRVTEAQRVFQVGLQRRANAVYQQAAALVRAGALGQVSAITCQWHRNHNWRRPVPVPRTDPKWPALERRLNWRLYRASSAGLMAELGSHQLDVATWVLGATPRRVVASGGIDYWRDGRDVPDTIVCIYDYELPTPPSAPGAKSGSPAPYTVRVTYSSLCNNAYEGASELILGTRGSLFLTPTQGLLYREQGPDDAVWTRSAPDDAAVLTAGKTLKLSNAPWARRGEPIAIENVQGDDTRDQLVSFLDHVRRRDVRTLCDVAEGLRNTATVLMANQALDSGQAVDYPAVDRS
ncbi:MAG TPA: Gfo/Idh/MocA family oxidoreductase [Isosphaeraceae bacterium]